MEGMTFRQGIIFHPKPNTSARLAVMDESRILSKLFGNDRAESLLHIPSHIGLTRKDEKVA